MVKRLISEILNSKGFVKFSFSVEKNTGKFLLNL